MYGSYDLVADENGVVSCMGCGATELYPEAEAVREADGSQRRLEGFFSTFRRQARAGLR